MNPGSRARRAFTMIELLLVTVCIALLAGILWPVVASAKRASARTSCTTNLRQIGMAFQMYANDYDAYPSLTHLARSTYLRDRRVLVCPDDTSEIATGSISSYIWRWEVPPAFAPMNEVRSLPSEVVIAVCDHHLGRRTLPVKGDSTVTTEPTYPHYLVLRSGGSVQRAAFPAVRKVPVPAERVRAMGLPPGTVVMANVYPGEPGYDRAEK